MAANRWWALFAALFFLTLSRPAWAINIGLCANLAASYTDADSTITPADANTDYFNSSPVNQPAYGMWIEVYNSGGSTPIYDNWLQDDNGTFPGCTVAANITVTSGTPYDVKVFSKMKIHNDTVILKKRRSGQSDAIITYKWTGVSFTTNNAYSVLNDVPDTEMSRILAVLGFALSRKDGGMSGQTINIWDVDAASIPSGCGTSIACNSGGDIYYGVDATLTPPDATVYKSVMAHEFGHQVMNDVTVYTIPGPNYNAPTTNLCQSGPTNGHLRNGIEWHSAAVVEGFAHFYADAVFNVVGGTGCADFAKNAIDWDLTDSTNSPVNPYRCDDSPVAGLGLSTGDWEYDNCYTSPFNSLQGLANEYDYERFFWDMADKEGASVAQLIDILSDANASGPWNGNYLGNSDDVAARLVSSATLNGFDASPTYVWNTEIVGNGVFR